jgi:hypothetical protein
MPRSPYLGFVHIVLAIAGSGCGPNALFVSADLGPNAKCRFVADPSLSVDQPTFDIAQGATPGSSACVVPFLAHLLVENQNAATVAVESADVRLTTKARLVVNFDRARPSLPNPFIVSANSTLPANGKGVAQSRSSRLATLHSSTPSPAAACSPRSSCTAIPATATRY